jgi:putative heme-binding domain-containing protein
VLTQKGSGYEADRSPDFLLANDAWARFINLQYGPDGNVYLIDWYDKQACHHGDPTVWDRDTGRIYKVSHKDSKSVSVDLRKVSDADLVKYQLHDNDWYVRHARRLLQERGGNKDVHEALHKIAFDHKDETRRLRGLWALHATGGLTAERISKGLQDRSAYVRGWTIQLATEKGKASADLLKTFAELAKNDPSPVVRLYLASALQRLPLSERWSILDGLTSHKVDAKDHNLPLMYWYAAEPLITLDAERALALASRAQTANLLPFMSRRVASLGTPPALAGVVAQLGTEKTANGRRAVLRGMQEGLAGQRNLPAPRGWKEASAKLLAGDDEEVRSRVVALGVVFGDQRSFAVLRKTLQDRKADVAARRQALASLVEARDKGVVSVLQGLTRQGELRGDAIRALASFDDEKTPGILLELYPSLDAANKRAVVNTLASRAAYGKALLDAVGKKAVPAGDVPADLVRNLRNLGDAALDKKIAEVWGVVRTTPKERLALIKQTKSMLLKPRQAPDVALGRTTYNKTCAQCHTLFGVGGKVGPDVTGANRASLDYLLENVLDPSAVIPKEYAATVLTLNSGRKITGIVRAETEKTLIVVTAEETLTIATKDVDVREASKVSMMPDDLLKNLSEHEVRSLFAYLRSPTQTGFLATADNAKDLFNGKDLTGWVGDPKLWKVDNGEIVGKTAGLKRNEFLRSEMVAADFKLTVKVKLVPDKENSGIQFRSEPLPDGEVKGPQADVGAGWWGKLYEEHGRGLIWKESGEKHVKVDDWNEYVVEAVGSKVKTWINGKLCVDLDDEKLSRRGIFAFQLHSGGALEVRFKDVKLEVLAAKK